MVLSLADKGVSCVSRQPPFLPDVQMMFAVEDVPASVRSCPASIPPPECSEPISSTLTVRGGPSTALPAPFAALPCWPFPVGDGPPQSAGPLVLGGSEHTDAGNGEQNMKIDRPDITANEIPHVARAESQIFTVDSARLAHGNWCHRADKTVGEGDISASYSADRIAMGQSIRKPFRWQGADWVCVSSSFYHGVFSANAYRVVHPQQFQGNPTSYREKTRDGDAARADSNGFYHGMTVTHAGQTMVLCGPPAIFIPGQTAQLDLFGSD